MTSPSCFRALPVTLCLLRVMLSRQKVTTEVVNGFKEYFNRALGTVLLYKLERLQYKARSALNSNCPLQALVCSPVAAKGD